MAFLRDRRSQRARGRRSPAWPPGCREIRRGAVGCRRGGVLFSASSSSQSPASVSSTSSGGPTSSHNAGVMGSVLPSGRSGSSPNAGPSPVSVPGAGGPVKPSAAPSGVSSVGATVSGTIKGVTSGVTGSLARAKAKHEMAARVIPGCPRSASAMLDAGMSGSGGVGIIGGGDLAGWSDGWCDHHPRSCRMNKKNRFRICSRKRWDHWELAGP